MLLNGAEQKLHGKHDVAEFELVRRQQTLLADGRLHAIAQAEASIAGVAVGHEKFSAIEKRQICVNAADGGVGYGDVRRAVSPYGVVHAQYEVLSWQGTSR